MTEQTNLVPKRRFKEFQNTHSWEKRELDSIYKKIRNAFVGTATPYYVESGNFYLESNNVKDGKINRITEVFINDEFYEKQKDKWLHTGDLVMVQSGHVGHTAVIEEELDGTAAHALIMFQEYKEQVDPYFLNFQFQTREAKRKLENITTGNTIKHILASEMKKFEVIVPQIEEQNKIGTFFKILDDNIDLQQRKLEKTKALKSAYLSEMFPGEGERKPKRRFAGFTHTWEQWKLEDMGRTFTGLSGKTKEDFGHGSAEFVTYMNVFSNPISDTSMTENVEVDSKQNELKYGDVLFTTSSETPQEVGMSSVWLGNRPNVYLNSFCFGYRPTVNVNYLFLAYLLRSNGVRKQMMLLAQGISRYNISKNKVMELRVGLPDIQEQEKIGNFFKQLDDTIALHQYKLEKLQNIKKAYLNGMFV